MYTYGMPLLLWKSILYHILSQPFRYVRCPRRLFSAKRHTSSSMSWTPTTRGWVHCRLEDTSRFMTMDTVQLHTVWTCTYVVNTVNKFYINSNSHVILCTYINHYQGSNVFQSKTPVWTWRGPGIDMCWHCTVPSPVCMACCLLRQCIVKVFVNWISHVCVMVKF